MKKTIRPGTLKSPRNNVHTLTIQFFSQNSSKNSRLRNGGDDVPLMDATGYLSTDRFVGVCRRDIPANRCSQGKTTRDTGKPLRTVEVFQRGLRERAARVRYPLVRATGGRR